MRAPRRTRPPRPWAFWRRAFWTPAGFFVGYAVLAVAAAGGLVAGAVGTWHEVQTVQAHRLCGPAVAGSCLTRVSGEVSGPFNSGGRFRGPATTWRLDDDGRRIDAFDLTLHDSALLAGNDRHVSALMYGDRVVIVELSDGREVTASTDSWRAVVLFLALALALLALAAGLWRYARKKRRTTGSWWSVSGPATATGDIPVFVAFIVPVGVAVAVMFGFDWRPVAAVTAAAAAYLGWGLWRDRRDRRREPDLPGLTRRR